MKFKKSTEDAPDIYLELKEVAHGVMIFGRKVDDNISYPLIVFHDGGIVDVNAEHLKSLGLELSS